MSKGLAVGMAAAAVLASAAVPGAAAPVDRQAARADRRPPGAAPAALAGRRVQIMVAGRTSTLLRARRIKVPAGAVRIGRRRCAVPARTALAGLLAVRLHVAVTDQSGCDPAAMFVTRIKGESNRGQAGWEYKVGHADPSFGAADPGGRLKGGRQLLWYWCVRANDCQRTLSVRASFNRNSLVVQVLGYDQNGHGLAIGAATVHYGTGTELTDSRGRAIFVLAGVHELYATKPGLVRSFPVTVGVVS